MIQSLFGSTEKEPSLLERLKSSVVKTRAGLVSALEDALQGKKEIDADLLDELESTLISADVGARTTAEILERIRQRVERHQVADAAQIRGLISEHLLEILQASDRPRPHVDQPPAVIMVVGVNGSGKTTTIGKLAYRFKEEGRTALLCAADTFRAAAIDQLEIWGERSQTGVIRQQHGSDPSAVIFDALQAALARKVDYVIVDTAGRLQTKENLMAELQTMFEFGELKIARTMRHAAALRKEMVEMRTKVTPAGNEQFGAWREGEHDDLVFAVALACWGAKKRFPRKPTGMEAYWIRRR